MYSTAIRWRFDPFWCLDCYFGLWKIRVGTTSKSMNCVVLGLLWMLTVSTAGLYFKWAFIEDGLHWQNTVFYAFFVLSFGALIWYYYKIWKL